MKYRNNLGNCQFFYFGSVKAERPVFVAVAFFTVDTSILKGVSSALLESVALFSIATSKDFRRYLLVASTSSPVSLKSSVN